MTLKIIGKGSFGDFLSVQFEEYLDENSENVILAVPFDAYEDVAAQNKGKHLINVCSVQKETNEILLRHSDKVTGIHPLFGPRSFGSENHVCAITKTTGAHSDEICLLFKKSGCRLIECDEDYHDKIMAKVHLPLIKISDEISEIINGAKEIPYEFLPPSFKKLREFQKEMKMPEGTRNSILANKF